jgi:KUP system potassium uptake protein
VLARSTPERVKGVAVFLTGHPDSTPSALLHNLKHNKVLHEQNVIMNVSVEDTPRVPEQDRLSIERLSDAFWRVTLRFGFMEEPNVLHALAGARAKGLAIDVMRTSFFLSRRALRLAPKSELPRWQERLFVRLAQSANDASQYFGIPSGRAVEVGTQMPI